MFIVEFPTLNWKKVWRALDHLFFIVYDRAGFELLRQIRESVGVRLFYFFKCVKKLFFFFLQVLFLPE